MQLLRAEWRKHCTFREAWVGYILGVAFLTLALYTQWIQYAPVPAEYIRQYWFSMQQNIYTYGATLTAFLLVVGLSRLLCYECECKADSLIFTAKSGVSYGFKAKALLSVQYCAIVVAVIGTISILVNGAMFGFAGASEQMTEGVYFHQVPMNNLLYCVVQYVFLLLGALYFGGFILMVAALVKRSVPVMFIAGGCYIAFLVYYYVGCYWVQGTWFDTVCDFLFHYGFSGFMLQESFSYLSASDTMLRGVGDWLQVWRPILFVLAMTSIEFIITWLLWRRRERR